MSRIRAALVQLVRAHQAEPISRSEHPARQSVYGAAVRRDDGSEGSAFDSLWSETGKHSLEVVSCICLCAVPLITLLKTSITSNQSHRLRFGMSWTTNGLQLHSVEVLPVAWSPSGNDVHCIDRHVVSGLYCCRAISRIAFVPRHQWIQSNYTNCWNAGVSTLVLVRTTDHAVLPEYLKLLMGT